LDAPARPAFLALRNLRQLEAEETVMAMTVALSPYLEPDRRRELVDAILGRQDPVRSAVEGLADLRNLIDALNQQTAGEPTHGV
jgi:hypothetical protein